MKKLTIKYSPKKLKLHVCKTELGDLSTYSPILMLTASFKPFLTSMKAGESDITRPSLAVMPTIFFKTTVLLLSHGIKQCSHQDFAIEVYTKVTK